MSSKFKKVLVGLSSIVFIPSITANVVSCTSDKYDDIFRPDPIMPITKNGFEKVNLDNINIEKIYYTDDLLKQIINSLELGGYKEDNLKIQVFKNNSEISLKDDLYRNGTYKFIISNKENANDNITASIKISNSVHLQDVFKVTTIGNIYDNRPRTIMMALMFNNIDMVNQLSKVGDELTDVSKFDYKQNNKGAIIRIKDEVPKQRPESYYGSLDVNYQITPFIAEEIEGQSFPMTISEIVKISNNKVPTISFGKLEGKDKYTVLMQFIIENLSNPTYWALFVNDLDLDNFESLPIENSANQYKIRFYSKDYQKMQLPETAQEQNGDYDKKAHYLNDKQGIELTFSYFD
ncbi:hypothetical protein [Spiroplasma cantharicola]|uniref:Lipoprotein n=1 Tax=Spiroplasma cantharicola TaxID=362837 RepID=A0A0M4K260_9MOLU|nr:hypothetical protein [Spiroplasma cantharicola]ALD66800.1 hypothetical protein SCANT_v1c08940 [Spiroplasma cantharicola]